MKKKWGMKLTTYFLLSIFASFVAASFIFSTILSLMQEPIMQFTTQDSVNTTGGSVIAVLIIVAGLLLFLGIFIIVVSLFMRPKIQYIYEISNQVSQMEKQGFGRWIEVRGRDELAELSTSINSMSATLKEKIDHEKEEEEQKNKLIADISHDLRTPLTSVVGYVELIRENGFQDKAKFDQYMEVVERRLGDMQSMTNQLFEYTKLSQGDFKLSREKVNLTALLQQVDMEYGTLFGNQGFAWACAITDKSIIVDLDTEKFMRALGNLLDNAKKYAVPGSKVYLDMAEEKGCACIRLSNLTTGMEQEELDHLFERFYKTDQSRKSEQSTGLGLPIARRIMELHGGSLKAHMENKWIEFVIKLPIC